MIGVRMDFSPQAFDLTSVCKSQYFIISFQLFFLNPSTTWYSNINKADILLFVNFSIKQVIKMLIFIISICCPGIFAKSLFHGVL